MLKRLALPHVSVEGVVLPVQEVAEKWHLSEAVVRRLFQDEPGVIKIEAPERRFKRGYCSLRIPESVES